MITAPQAINEVFTLIWNSTLRSEITGSVKKYKRPTGSDLEDITINTLPISFEQLQEGVMNVNIHVPNPAYTVIIQGKPQVLRDLPDEVRIEELAGKFAELIKFQYSKGILIEMQQQVVLADEDKKSTFVNNRLNIRAKNL